MQQKLNCTECGKYTHDGQLKRQEYFKQHPIWGTDLNQPLSKTIAGIRRNLTNLRGSLSDIMFAFPGWKDRLDVSEAGITLVIMALHATMVEMEKLENAKD